MKSIPKTNISFNFYHLPSSTVLDRKVTTTIKILKQIALFLLLLRQISFLQILVCSSLLCFVFRLTNWTVSRVEFVYHSKVGIQSCSLKLLFSYSPQVFFQGYGKRQLYITTLFLAQLCTAVSSHLINKCDKKIRQVKN